MSEDQIQPEPRRRRPDGFQGDTPEEDRPRRRRRDDDDDDDPRFRRPDPVESIIPYRNPLALTSYYLGVFSLIPCAGLALGPAALITGWLGLNYQKKHSTAGGTGHAITGIILGCITSLGNWGVVALGLAAAVFA